MHGGTTPRGREQAKTTPVTPHFFAGYIAMVFGMLPIALGLGAGGTQRAPMAVTVIGGLITSTMLTLVLVPVVYTLMDDLTELRLGNRLAARMGWVRPEEEPQAGKG